MIAPLLILATLAAGIVLVGLSYALLTRVPARVLAAAGVVIVLTAGATLVSIVVRDMRARTGTIVDTAAAPDRPVAAP